MSAAPLLAEIGLFLAEHADLVQDVFEILKSGGDPEVAKAALRDALREAKAKISDQAMKEELDAIAKATAP